MRIVLITMNDPIYTLPFMKDLIAEFDSEVVLVVSVMKGDRLTLRKGKSKMVYLISLVLIMGIYNFSKLGLIHINYKLKIFLSRHFSFIESPKITAFARQRGIDAMEIDNPNSKDFLKILRELDPDIIVNQSQSILKKKILSIPKIGVLNRHNALLPKNRGRLTPFWVLYKVESETGVSIHFMNEDLDAGPIIVQRRFTINPSDTFNSIVRKNYEIASSAMIQAIHMLKEGFTEFIDNDDTMATYNSTPSLKEALCFRIKVSMRFFKSNRSNR